MTQNRTLFGGGYGAGGAGRFERATVRFAGGGTRFAGGAVRFAGGGTRFAGGASASACPPMPRFQADMTHRKRARVLWQRVSSPAARRVALISWLALCAMCAAMAAQARLAERQAAVSVSAPMGEKAGAEARVRLETMALQASLQAAAVRDEPRAEAQTPRAAYPPIDRASTVVVCALPDGLATVERRFTREELLAGKLLLIDAAHPIPQDAPPPNTVSLREVGAGRVPVRNDTVKAHPEVAEALAALFDDARSEGLNGFVVWAGARSAAEQRQAQLNRMALASAGLPLEEAARLARAVVPEPFCSEHQTPCAVDILVARDTRSAPDLSPLSESREGRWLLDNAARFGFVHGEGLTEAESCRIGHFRYVGAGHSRVMSAMGKPLAEYLALLRKKRVAALYENGEARYIVLCAPMENGGATFRVPENAVNVAVSGDNAGYAVLICEIEAT